MADVKVGQEWLEPNQWSGSGFTAFRVLSVSSDRARCLLIGGTATPRIFSKRLTAFARCELVKTSTHIREGEDR